MTHLDIAREAAHRWQERQENRDATTSNLESVGVGSVETAERLGRRLERLRETPVAPKAPVELEGSFTLERVIGKPNFQDIAFIETGLAVAAFVGRVEIFTSPGVPGGFGTGFMVSPRLMLTNNHVLDRLATARHSRFRLDYQLDSQKNELPSALFSLEPDTFFLTDRRLDYSLVAVASHSAEGRDIADYAWCRLLDREVTALIGDPLNIIQHPMGRHKEIVTRENELVDLPSPFAHYVTDTEPGSSGSPVFNDQWEVVALHHSGVPDMDENGNFLKTDGTPWLPGDDPESIKWVANEGIQVDDVLGHVKAQDLHGPQAALRTELLDAEPPHPVDVATLRLTRPPQVVVPDPPVVRRVPENEPSAPATPTVVTSTSGTVDGAVTWTVPIHITVGIGAPGRGGETASVTADVSSPTPVETSALHEAVTIDPDFAARSGYDPEFLGVDVPLPALSDAIRAQAAVNRLSDDPDDIELKYHHYSVVMNAERKLAFFTAANIDGARAERPERERDRWFTDPRIGLDQQTHDDLYYKNPLDKGHLVRRLDTTWGDDPVAIKFANDDTFHYTNCSPQHKKLNRNKSAWAGLEDLVLNNADLDDRRVSVFTGHVFRDDDRSYRGVRLPREYWKVVVTRKAGGELSATAYLLSQEDHLHDPDLLERVTRVDPDKFKTRQKSIRSIEELTGLDFGALKDADPLEGSDTLESTAERVVRGFEDLVL